MIRCSHDHGIDVPSVEQTPEIRVGSRTGGKCAEGLPEALLVHVADCYDAASRVLLEHLE
jgi:hypothetical protein